MSHRIEKPYDRIFSTVSREWHGLAEVVDTIDRETLSPILFPIIRGNIVARVSEAEIVLDSHNVLIADYRGSDSIPSENQLHPLSVVGQNYSVIDNGHTLSIVEAAIANGLDAKIVTAGTVRSGKSFFISLQQKDSYCLINGSDKWDFVLSIATSHDKTDCWNVYIASFRTVCWNTLRQSLDTAKISARVYHTKNAKSQLACMPEIMKMFRKGQRRIQGTLENLSATKCDREQAKRIVSGYLANPETNQLSERGSNTMEDILSLYESGTGNSGSTMYDLLNGFTEYYTRGNGAGKTVSLEDRLFRSEFGSAASHKERFLGVLNDLPTRNAVERLGLSVALK